MSFETIAPPYNWMAYETVSTPYLEGLKQAANLSGRRYRERNEAQGKAAKAEEALAAAKEEIGELKDLLKQTAKRAADYYKTPLAPGGKKFEMAFALGGQPDVKLAIKDSWGHKVVSVWRDGPKPDPDAPIIEALSVPYPATAGYILKQIRKAGLDITLKDQGKDATSAATSLKLVS